MLLWLTASLGLVVAWYGWSKARRRRKASPTPQARA